MMANLAPGEMIIIAIVLLAVAALAGLGAKVLLASRTSSNAWQATAMQDTGECKEPVDHETMRASSAERERTIERLREGTAQGRLTFAELEERVQTAQTAKTLGDLAQLTQDLPPEH